MKCSCGYEDDEPVVRGHVDYWAYLALSDRYRNEPPKQIHRIIEVGWSYH